MHPCDIQNDLRFFNRAYDRVVDMDHYDLYEALGLNPKRHLPAKGLSARYIGNVFVWVDPKWPEVNQDAKRVWCECPHCGKVLTAGKYQQHRRAKHKTPSITRIEETPGWQEVPGEQSAKWIKGE